MTFVDVITGNGLITIQEKHCTMFRAVRNAVSRLCYEQDKLRLNPGPLADPMNLSQSEMRSHLSLP